MGSAASERKRMQYEQRRAAGQCVACGSHPATRGVRCFPCAVKHAAKSQRWYSKRAA